MFMALCFGQVKMFSTREKAERSAAVYVRKQFFIKPNQEFFDLCNQEKYGEAINSWNNYLCTLYMADGFAVQIGPCVIDKDF